MRTFTLLVFLLAACQGGDTDDGLPHYDLWNGNYLPTWTCASGPSCEEASTLDRITIKDLGYGAIPETGTIIFCNATTGGGWADGAEVTEDVLHASDETRGIVIERTPTDSLEGTVTLTQASVEPTVLQLTAVYWGGPDCSSL